MNRLNRRRFLALSSAGAASAVLVACGNPKPTTEDVNPTQIPDVAGAPPTLAPITSTPQSGSASKPSGGESAGGGQASITVEAGDLFFKPTEFSIAPGGTITLNNIGALEHDFAVDDWGGVLIGPFTGGGTGDFTVPADAKVGDSFEFYCSIPGHKAAGMVGTVTVAEEGAGGTEEEATAAAGAADSVAVEAGDIYFKPTEFSITPGGTISLHNVGQLDHDFAVDDWGGVLIGPFGNDGKGDFTVPADAKVGDSFKFYCSIPGHEAAGMVGTVTVAEAGGGEAAAATATEEEASPTSDEATAAVSPASGGVSEVTIAAGDLFFDPSEFEITPGGTITLNNEGMLEHDFAVDDWGGVVIDSLNGGESGSFTVPEDAQPGETFEFYCAIPGHKAAGMVGKVTIAEGGGGESATTTPNEAATATDEEAPADQKAAGASSSVAAAEVTISAFEFGYDPAEVEVAPGTKIIMTNDGHVEHDIAVDGWGGVIVALTSGGGQAEGVVPADAQAGETLDFYCTVAGHKESGMVGKFTVIAGGAGEAGGEASPESSPAAQGTGNVITIASNEWAYSPSKFDVAPGDTIVLRNDGAMAHDMSSEEWGKPFIPDVKHGETGSFVVPSDAKVGSTIEIFSMNQGATKLGMKGTITVVEKTEGSLTAPPAPAATPATSLEGTPAAVSSGGGKIIEIEAGDLYFDPNNFEASPGDTIKLTNAGVLEHDMASQALGVTMVSMLSAGDSGEYVIPDDASGEVDIYCTVSGHKEAGMTGTITIV